MRRVRRRPLLWTVVFSVLSTIVGIAICLRIDWFPAQASSAAADIDTLFDVLLVVSVPIFVMVMAVIFYSLIAFKAQPGELSDGAPIHGSTRLEVIWVTIPAIIVSALAVYGWVVLDDIEAKEPGALVVNVTGQQFAWRFAYPNDGKVRTNKLMLPQGRPVHFKVKTDDVIHDFWVPEFRLKTDAVPGLTTDIRTTPTRVGTYSVVCAELCGIGHATMRQQVQVMPKAQFDSWIAKKRGGGAK